MRKKRAKLTQACQRTACSRCNQGLRAGEFSMRKGGYLNHVPQSLLSTTLAGEEKREVEQLEVYAHIWSMMFDSGDGCTKTALAADNPDSAIFHLLRGGPICFGRTVEITNALDGKYESSVGLPSVPMPLLSILVCESL
jgi:hypothetical protein